MGTNFNKTIFFSGSSDLAFKKYGKDVASESADHLKFSTRSLKWKEFSPKYMHQGWIGRKVIAIPCVLLIGTVKVSYDVACAIFSIKLRSIGNGKMLKAHLYCLIRDVQEISGWAVTLVNDKLGQFLIQGAKYQRSCYQDSIRQTRMDRHFKSRETKAPNLLTSEIKSIKLSRYTKSEIDTFFKRFKISNSFVKAVDALNLAVRKSKFEQLSPQEVQKALIQDLFTDDMMALISKDQLKGININDIPSDVLVRFLGSNTTLGDRFSKLPSSSLDDAYKVSGESHPLVKIFKSLASQPYSFEYHQMVSSGILGGLSNALVKVFLEASFFPKEQDADWRYKTFNHIFFDSDYQRKFDALPADIVKKWVQQDLIPDPYLILVSKEQLAHLRPLMFERNQISLLFDTCLPKEVNQYRFAGFSGESIFQGLLVGHFKDPRIIDLFSNEHFRSIQLSKLFEVDIDLLLPSDDTVKGISRLNKMNPLDVLQAYNSHKLPKAYHNWFKETFLSSHNHTRGNASSGFSGSGAYSTRQNPDFDDFFKGFNTDRRPPQAPKNTDQKKEAEALKVLSLEAGATRKEIVGAYKKLAMQWHPDKNRGNEAVAEERFKEISCAHELLIDALNKRCG